MRYLLTILLAFFLTQTAFAEMFPLRYFRNIDEKDGLSNNSAMSVVQDSMGVMWIGTRNGLNSYDGFHIRNYVSRPGDLNALAQNRIKKLDIDNMMLYIQTSDYLTIYDIKKELFVNVNTPDIRDFDIHSEYLYVISDSKISILDRFTGDVTQDVLLTKHHLSMLNGELVRLLQVKDDLYYIGTESALYTLNRTNDELLRIIGGVDVTNFFTDKEGRKWVATKNRGVFRLSSSGEVIENLTVPDLSHNYVRAIEQDKNGNIVIGTFKGLDSYDVTNKKVVNYHSNNTELTQLSHSSIWSLCSDRDGSIWIGTYFGGVNILAPEHPIFSYYNYDNNSRALGNIIGEMKDDDDGNIYIANHGGGMSYFNTKTNKIVNYTNKNSSLGCNNVQAIQNYKDSVILLATNTDGLNIFDISRKKFRSTSALRGFKQLGISSNITDIEPYDDKFLFSTSKNIYQYDLRNSEVRPFDFGDTQIPMEDIVDIEIDNEGRIWISSGVDGAFMYNPKNKHYEHFVFNINDVNSLPTNTVNSIYEDRRSRIWVMTQSGLCLYLPEINGFKTITMEDGLPSNNVYMAYDSRHSDIVITTPLGLSIYSNDKNQFVSYTSNNGLPLSPVTHKSLLYSRNGYIYIGGYNGFVKIDEKEVFNRYEQEDKIYPTSLKVFDRYISAADSAGIFKQNIILTKKIKLPYTHNSFSLSFSNMQMIDSKRCELEYMLEGFDDDYIFAGDENTATYTNLDYTDYTFKVRYVDAQDNSPELAFDIVIKPPFYYSTFAFICYALLIITIATVLIRLYYLHSIASAMLNIEKNERERDAEYNEAKLRFFTNISHELRTPLTLISGQLERIISDPTLFADSHDRAVKAHKSSLKLQYLINELLDLRKLQKSTGAIILESVDIRSVVNEVFVSFIELAKDRKIEYVLNLPENESLFTLCDIRGVEKILYNLISNAFKFTSSGEISISLSRQNEWVEIVVKDSGEGIDSENVNRIFERFYQQTKQKRAYDMQRGTGIGLALVKELVSAHQGSIEIQSKKGVGSSFIVKLQSVSPPSEKEKESVEQEDLGNYITDIDSPLNQIIEKLSKRNEQTKRKILVVEDNVAMLDFLVDLLSSHYEVESAIDGEQGYKKAIEFQPDIVLSDVMMPNMSGTEMCSLIKSDIKCSHIPVVLITAKTALEHKIEGLELGADDYITKPFSIKLLVVRIANILDRRSELQKHYLQGNFVAKSESFPTTSLDKSFLLRALDLMQKNISNEEYSVDDFAADMMLGRTVFFKKMKGVVNMTPNEFMLSIRLKQAEQLLVNSPELTMVEIVDKCGFSTVQYFTTVFKKKFNHPPAKYQKLAQKGESV